MQLKPGMQVLVINVARIGDTLLCTPAIRALRRAVPAGRVTVLAHPDRRCLLQNLPFIDELRGMTPRQAWWRQWGLKARYDVAVVYGNDPALLKLARQRAAYTVGFSQQNGSSNRWLDHAVPRPEAPMHAVRERMLLPAALGVESREEQLAYAPRESEILAIQRWLASQSDGAPLVGLQMASFPTKGYRDWPLERFVELVSGLLTRWPELRFVALGDRLSRERATQLAREFPGRIISAAGRFSLRKSAALLSQLDLYVGVDTGPTHLAGALGIPMVGLYHCYHRGEWLAPLQHPMLEVVEHPALIARRDSPMAELGAARVLTAIECLARRLPVDHPMHTDQE